MSAAAQIGIDIGMNFSRVAVMIDGRPQLIANELASKLTPSYVAYTDKMCHVGDRAKQQAVMNVSNTIYGVRRSLGRKFDECDSVNFPYRTVRDGDRPSAQVDYKGRPKYVAPEEIIALLIEKMVEIAEKSLRQKVEQAIITVPSQFNCSQRIAVKNAARIAGIKGELINETTAATMAYIFEKQTEFYNKRRILLVYNMGGGFTTATIVSVTSNHFDVLATAGDLRLGGDDVDQLLVDHCCEKILEKQKIDLKSNPRAICRLRRACEKAKRDLSFSVQAAIEVDDISPGVDFELVITRSQFDAICGSFFDRALLPVRDVLKDAKLRNDEIDEIVMVGGSTRMPCIQQQLRTMFYRKCVDLSINQDEAAVLGAVLQTVGGITFRDVIPATFAVEDDHGRTITLYSMNEHFPRDRPYVINTRFSKDILKVLQMGDSYCEEIGAYLLPMESRIYPTMVKYEVNTDGILVLSIEVAGNGYSIPHPHHGGCLTDSEIKSIRHQLDSYKKHRSADSERIVAKDGLQRYMNQLASKLKNQKLSQPELEGYQLLHQELSKWWTENTDADAVKYNDILQWAKGKEEEIHLMYNPPKPNQETVLENAAEKDGQQKPKNENRGLAPGTHHDEQAPLSPAQHHSQGYRVDGVPVADENKPHTAKLIAHHQRREDSNYLPPLNQSSRRMSHELQSTSGQSRGEK